MLRPSALLRYLRTSFAPRPWLRRAVHLAAALVVGIICTLFAELASRAAVGWQGSDLEEFTGMLSRMAQQQQANDVPAFHATAFEFVHAALRFADNHYLQQALEDLLPQLQRCSYIALQAETSEIDVSYRLFQTIIERMLARDAAGTARAAREYGENQVRIVLSALEKQA